jgi:N,N'-diacetyllegionaminate synthase
MKQIKIGNKIIGDNSPTFIIAEAGVNHNGSLEMAKKLIDAAKESGADAVKFQTFKAEEVVTKNAEKAEYQKTITTECSQYEMIKKLELSTTEFKELSSYAKKKNIIFLSSPFDLDSIEVLNELNVPAFKFGSGEITNFPLLELAATKGKPMILSTGMATLGEIEEVFNLLKGKISDIIIMHCVTSYPAKTEDSNLKVIETLKCAFKVPIGFSDHTRGIEMAVAAVAMGACVIEKHFTLDKNLDGPDHKASLEPDELERMIKSIKNVEKGMGNGIKKLTIEEEEIKKIARKSIVARIDIQKDVTLKKEMLAIKRPGTGISPKYFNFLIGKKLKKSISADCLLNLDDVL